MGLRQRWWEQLGKALLSLGGNCVRGLRAAPEVGLTPFIKCLPGEGVSRHCNLGQWLKELPSPGRPAEPNTLFAPHLPWVTNRCLKSTVQKRAQGLPHPCSLLSFLTSAKPQRPALSVSP